MLRCATRTLGVATLLAVIWNPARTTLGAQRQQEFTQQGLLVAPFKSNERKLGNKVADEIRGRVEKAGNKRELEVIDEKSMTTALFNAGFPADMVPDLSQVRALSRYLRATPLCCPKLPKWLSLRHWEVHIRCSFRVMAVFSVFRVVMPTQ